MFILENAENQQLVSNEQVRPRGGLNAGYLGAVYEIIITLLAVLFYCLAGIDLHNADAWMSNAVIGLMLLPVFAMWNGICKNILLWGINFALRIGGIVALYFIIEFLCTAPLSDAVWIVAPAMFVILPMRIAGILVGAIIALLLLFSVFLMLCDLPRVLRSLMKKENPLLPK